MKNYTDITVLVDRSGSMATIKEDMEGGFAEFLNKHRTIPSTRLTLIQFDGQNDQEVIYTAAPIRTAEKLYIKPRGNTPLLDAFCKAIDRTGNRLAGMSEKDRPARVLMVIITDGQENCSQTFRREDVRERVTRQLDTYNWQFVYLGANQDAFAEARSFGIPLINTMNYRNVSPMFVAEDGYFLGNTLNYARGLTNTVSAFSQQAQTEAMAPVPDPSTVQTTTSGTTGGKQ